MNEKQSADQVDFERAGQLERLICGELDEPSRGSLISWLDEDPHRWRVCGLLFLESQTWSQAMTDWPPVSADRLVETGAVTRGNYAPRRPARSMAYAAALATSVVVSFFLGFAVRGANRASESHTQIAEDAVPFGPSRGVSHDVATAHTERETVIAMLPVKPSVSGMPASTVHIPVVREQVSSQGAQQLASDIPDYVRQQWRRRGYELNVQRRYLFAQLPDGERVAVPVDQYSFTHVPPKIN